MRRVINEMTSDEVQRGTGVKVGDFGTGGRTYVNRYTQDPARAGERSTTGCKIAFFILALIGIGIVFWAETSLFETIACLDEALHLAVTVPDAVGGNKHLDNQLVHVQVPDTPILAGTPATDSFFAISFGDKVGVARRVTEYCQWQETQHTKKIKEGTDRDGKDIIREETTYSYYKTWRNHRINSMMFDSPAAYHNPQRDPAPAKDLQPEGGIDLSAGKRNRGGYVISGPDFADAMLPWTTLPLYKDTVQKLGKEALAAGFSEADHRYVYSRVPKDGFTGSPIVKAAASYLVDGVLDVNEISSGIGAEGLLDKAGLGWITRGSCHAGDIRVSFETRTLPQTAAVLAQQVGGNKLVPYTYTNGASRVFATPVSMELPGMVARLAKEANWSNWLYRGGAVLLLLIAAYCGAQGFELAAGTIALFAALASGSMGAAWMYIGGVHMKVAAVLLGVAAVAGVYIVVAQRGSGNKTTGTAKNPASAAADNKAQFADNKAAFEAESKKTQ